MQRTDVCAVLNIVKSCNSTLLPPLLGEVNPSERKHEGEYRQIYCMSGVNENYDGEIVLRELVGRRRGGGERKKERFAF